MQVASLKDITQAGLNSDLPADQLARYLAEIQAPVEETKSSKRVLLSQHLPLWKQTLLEAYQYFRATSAKDLAFSRAGEWMLDNFYVVEQTFHQIEEDLPNKYFDELPKLTATEVSEYPRIFALAWELVGYGQGNLDPSWLKGFLQEYQMVTPLLIGELWAFPSMLRMGILERLARSVATITGRQPLGIIGSRQILPVSATQENETVVANCFISLRLISVTDWKTFFEETSRVEKVLSEDPAGVFGNMDFETRNKYRSVIEELARNSDQTEESVARMAIDFAGQARGALTPSQPDYSRRTHVGFYLIGRGRQILEKRVGFHPEFNVRLKNWILDHALISYLGTILGLSLLITASLLFYDWLSGGPLWQWIIVGILGFGLALEVAVNLVNWTATLIFPPRTLPRMDFSKKIPHGFRTMVVVPTLLGSIDELNDLLGQLELHFLANPDPQLGFALLNDFMDAGGLHMPGDEQLLEKAKAGIEQLNQKYSPRAPFYFFHRHRQWNQSEGAWIGWERKRGKLVEFNRLLLGTGDTSYSTQIGDLSILPEVRYVITLDADTLLPQGSANRLVATLAHPLNQAIFSGDGTSVIAGYTILQPRVEIKPTCVNSSLFAQVYSGNTGIDLYTLAVSNVYQDLFAEGSYVGKGIYDVAAFDKSLHGQVRENTLLSHDLFEGLYGRAALVTDIVLYEDFPARYLVHGRRLGRWIRGDWQLLPWLFPKVRTEQGVEKNRLELLDRWKIFDNLRRSLLSPLTLVFFTVAWLALSGSPLAWTLILLLAPAVTIAAHTINLVGKEIRRFSLRNIFQATRLPLVRWALAIVFLPYEAFLAMDSIGTTLIRIFITRRHLLNWTTAAHFAISFKKTRLQTWLEMAVSLAFNTLLGIAITMVAPNTIGIAVPILIAWVFSPQIAYWISQPIQFNPPPLSDIQRRKIQRLARRTWAYFDKFTGPEDHWLPPDHFQENPRGNLAHYTTPTNIGLFLLSTLSAYDLGYIGPFDLAVRLRSTFESMEKLEHYRGHLLNWYDTQTLSPLPPHYVSTVDSGNLAACLIILKQGCIAMKDAPLVEERQWKGLLVILDILSEILIKLEGDNPLSTFRPFSVELDSVRQRIGAVQSKPWAWTSSLVWLSSEEWYRISNHLIELLKSIPADVDQEIFNELELYLDTLHQQLISMQRNIKLLAPWYGKIDRPPRLFIQKNGPFANDWQDFVDKIPTELPTLSEAAGVYDNIQIALDVLQNKVMEKTGPAKFKMEARDWCKRLANDLTSSRSRAETLLIGFDDLVRQADAIVEAMDFKFLFDEQRQVFHIGYNVTAESLDTSYYDLLASEARIASLVAIAKGDVPQRHWLYLARPITRVNGRQVLLSWSGTMFEYLMPSLFCRNFPGTFLFDSCINAISAQISYARQKHMPWGVSESGFYAFDSALNYQYRAFGVPELGYKRDLIDDAVITPYASLMGLSFKPQAVLENLAHLEKLRMIGQFGLFEALDYTESRLPSGKDYAIVQSYMAHHQGMIMLSIGNYLTNETIINRFHSDEHIKSVELLLQEKIPENPHFEYPHPEEPSTSRLLPRLASAAPWRVSVDAPMPQIHYLNQGNYGLMISSVGSGYSQWQEFALTRWHSDTTLENWGTWIYIQDRESGELWSATRQPVGGPAESHEVQFYPHKVDFHCRENGLSIYTEVIVGREELEIRRVTVHNDSDKPRRIKLVSYGEVVLAAQDVDLRHPAFNKLFIESEYLQEKNALLFHRRSRSSEEKSIYLAHAIVAEAGRDIDVEYESDRERFIGRGHTLRKPIALEDRSGHLSGTVGSTLDPIMSLAQEFDLKPHSRTQVVFLTLAGNTSSELMERIDHLQSDSAINQEIEAARIRSEEELAETGIASVDLSGIQQVLSALLYSMDKLRAAPETLEKNDKGQPGLWAYGISGDLPILLLHVIDADEPLLLEALQAYIFWRNRKIKVNLVILNDQDTGYNMELHNQVIRLMVHLGADTWLNQRDGIFFLRSDQIPAGDLLLLETIAGAILDPQKGSLAEQAKRLLVAPVHLPKFTSTFPSKEEAEPTPSLAHPEGLQFNNGLGGFDANGKEYLIYLEPGRYTPHPWVNVIANPGFGFLVSEAGSSCTWSLNSGENRLTPWNNDPVLDTPGEALYLRDEETGLLWSPTPLPAGAETSHIIRHGAGYSIFESQSHGLEQTLSLFVDPTAPVKIIRLRLRNIWSRPRRITVTYYVEWVLGIAHAKSQPTIVSEFDSTRHALLAVNRYNTEFGSRVAFLAANKKPHGLTADRDEFLGRLGDFRSPAALERIGLASTVRAGVDPCAAIQLHIDLEPGRSEEVFFLLGEGKDKQESIRLISEYQAHGKIEQVWQAVQREWDDVLGRITVHTPDTAMDLLLNRWLLYQTVSCRLWGRTALYQSSGAFGFRDQLQDVLAVMHSHPALVREHIILAASRQFDTGDVLHWWHPPSGRGLRTRFSDDLLWLPYVTAEYVKSTGDIGVLNEQIPFLAADPLRPEEMERYGQFEPAAGTASLFEHCKRALEKGTTAGSHDLPLMGTGDWNDGMNQVGVKGQGESIWLGWFLYATLTRFVFLCDLTRNSSSKYRQQAENLARSLEANAWDGDWYIRAYFDNGSRLGSRMEEECTIDSIAQSWAVLSEAANPQRARRAMASVDKLLVREADRLILLLNPPFDKTKRDPGYIKGYPPGIRENGGQYTHAAIWSVWAFVKLGQGDRAVELFDLLNPVFHADTPKNIEQYKVEPYVVAADIYSQPPFTRRGGWTWYTGSSGWLYRLGIEAILGISREGNILCIDPCIPGNWPGYDVSYRFGETTYKIHVDNSQGVNQGVRQILFDEIIISNNRLALIDDGKLHDIQVVLGTKIPRARGISPQ
jgi:cyclic beta-1,2-glucan synthetase